MRTEGVEKGLGQREGKQVIKNIKVEKRLLRMEGCTGAEAGAKGKEEKEG